MGPRLFSVEYAICKIHVPMPMECYNGATLIQRGIPTMIGNPEKPSIASMGPRLFSVEYRSSDGTPSAWARQASMGPRLFSVEYSMRSGLGSISVGASMGPRLFSVEYGLGSPVAKYPERGFNGATLIQRGILAPSPQQQPHRPPLQWGHAYSAWNTAEGQIA